MYEPSFKDCPTCGEFMMFKSHQCQPKWNIWNVDEADADNEEQFTIVFAGDAREAAQKAALKWYDPSDGPATYEVYVSPWEQEDQPHITTAERFCLRPEYELRFECFKMD